VASTDNTDPAVDVSASESGGETHCDVSGATTWWVYLLRCGDDTFYSGIARSVPRRLRQHNGELKGGARYTRSRRPVLLLAVARAPDRATALRAERQLKALPRHEKLRWLQLRASAGADS